MPKYGCEISKIDYQCKESALNTCYMDDGYTYQVSKRAKTISCAWSNISPKTIDELNMITNENHSIYQNNYHSQYFAKYMYDRLQL